MGEIINIHCHSCHTHWECRTGSGLMHGTLHAAAEAFPAGQQPEILLAAEQTPLSLFTFAFRPARCNHCAAIVSIPILTLTENGTVFIGPCPICGHKAKPITRLSKCACPVCGKITLDSEETGRWD